MRLEDLYRLAKQANTLIGDVDTADMVIYLNDVKHENLQQEVHRLSNKTLQGYKSKNKFDIILYNIKFTFKIR
jgi:hypothetical protein